MQRWMILLCLLLGGASLAWGQAGRPIVEGQACGGNLTGTYPNCSAPGAVPGGTINSLQYNLDDANLGGSTRWDVDPATGRLEGSCTRGTLDDCRNTLTSVPVTQTTPTTTNEVGWYVKQTGSVYEWCWAGQGDSERCVSGPGGGSVEATEYFDGAGCADGATGTLNWDADPAGPEPTATCYADAAKTIGLADFGDAANSCMIRHLRIPQNTTAYGPFHIVWRSAAITGTVRWTIQTMCEGLDENATAFNAVDANGTTDDAASPTTNARNFSTFSNPTVTGCAAGNSMYIRVCRDISVGGNMTGPGRIQAVQLRFTRTLP